MCLLLQDLVQSCGTREEPGTLTQGASVFPDSSRLGIEPKTPGLLFITAVPNTKLCSWGEEDSGGHVL